MKTCLQTFHFISSHQPAHATNAAVNVPLQQTTDLLKFTGYMSRENNLSYYCVKQSF